MRALKIFLLSIHWVSSTFEDFKKTIRNSGSETKEESFARALEYGVFSSTDMYRGNDSRFIEISFKSGFC